MFSWLNLLTIVIASITGFLCFLYGFFPLKSVLAGFSSFADHDKDFSWDGEAHFDKVIVMVVDAMRSDFMFSTESSMSFLHSLIREGNAIPFTAFSHPPTVTLPRLKGLTTGGTPSFVDAILNVADDNDQSQSLSHVDSWLLQLKRRAKPATMHFYGDDTWLKLFPPSEFFERFEGTNSFFVSDFTEVDLNVTRHLALECEDTSWDVLILHYLGLDHIGHKGGPSSNHMRPKQREMDQIIKLLYTSRIRDDDRTLLVVMGDHGMNSIGNHGGSSPGETSPGLALISLKFSRLRNGQKSPEEIQQDFNYHSRVLQIDLVPTLSALLNVPIPKNNLGIMIPEMLPMWGDPDLRKHVLYENCKQLMNLLSMNLHSTDHQLLRLQRSFNQLEPLDDTNEDALYHFLREAQKIMSESATNYNYTPIILGMTLIAVSWLALCSQVWMTWKNSKSTYKGISYAALIAFSSIASLSVHASSLIEEEFQIWWFFIATSILISFCRVSWDTRWKLILILALLRIIRGWSNSGQKNSTSHTFSSFLEASYLSWVFAIFTYIAVLQDGMTLGCSALKKSQIQKDESHNRLRDYILQVSAVVSLVFKFVQALEYDPFDLNNAPQSDSTGVIMSLLHPQNLQKSSILLSRIFVFLLCASFIYDVLSLKHRTWGKFDSSDLKKHVTLLLLHQTKLLLIPMFFIYQIIDTILESLMFGLDTPDTEAEMALTSLIRLCLQHFCFFSAGNTNSLATIDLSNAYNGVSEYDMGVVGVLTFTSNFASAIYWSFASWRFRAKSHLARSARLQLLRSDALYSSFFYATLTLSLVISCVNLRFHLFIWSVFSPKLLYLLAWTLGVNFITDTLVAAGICLV